MKKKVFRERRLVEDKTAGTVKIPALEYVDGKVKPKKKASKKKEN